MMRFVNSPGKFEDDFNSMVLGAYCSITAQDIKDLHECGLIEKYGFYGRMDIETIRGVLQYEKLRLERKQQTGTVRTCKGCGESLPDDDGGRGGDHGNFVKVANFPGEESVLGDGIGRKS